MVNKILKKRTLAKRRAHRTRSRIRGTKECPRLSVKRSAKFIYAQIIDDVSGKTLVSASDVKIDRKKMKGKIDLAKEVGKTVAERAIDKKITKVVFDRGSYRYHGRVKALAEAAREA